MKEAFLIFGGSGLIGRSLKEKLRSRFSQAPLLEISRSTAVSIDTDLKNLKLEKLDPTLKSFNLMAFYCQGPTDPGITSAVHEKYHVALPTQWHQWLSQNTHLIKFVTLGSIHEDQDLSRGNSYLVAKSKWARYVQEKSEIKSFIHLKLHTIYGRPILKHSFIGEMFSSLRNGQDFLMSGGSQLREYHHVVDIAEVISLVPSQLNQLPLSPVLNLNHGRPISLKNLAEGIFEKLKPGSTLKVGALKSHPSEILETHWEATPQPFTPFYRDPIEGVSEVISEELILKGVNKRE